MKKKICIVSNQHISYNPRVVKEADALTEAGHDVRVITVCNNSEQHHFDQELMASRQWQISTVNYRRGYGSETPRWFWTGFRKKMFEKLSEKITFSYGFAERAHGREYDELTHLACSYPADLYIAHHAQTLGAAYHAAKKYHAFFAFDAEDFHTGEFKDTDSATVKRIEYLEKKYLPYCDYITAASENIAQALAQKYSIPLPETILNVFPLEEVRSQKSENRTPSLYWYSQVIGSGRGLEEVAIAMNQIDTPCQLHLRGTIFNNFDRQLKSLMKNPKHRIFFYPPAPPEQLTQLASEHDIGLALETGDCLNRLLCVTNKLFVYMTAGLAVIATDTPGQKTVMEQVTEAGIICKMADARSLTSAINELISNPVKLSNAKTASRKAAEKQFNWDIEKKKIIRIVNDCL